MPASERAVRVARACAAYQPGLFEVAEVSVADLAAASGLKEQDVEAAVVEAVTKGIMSAKIDQMNSCVNIGSGLHDDWSILSERLTQWKQLLLEMSGSQ